MLRSWGLWSTEVSGRCYPQWLLYSPNVRSETVQSTRWAPCCICAVGCRCFDEAGSPSQISDSGNSEGIWSVYLWSWEPRSCLFLVNLFDLEMKIKKVFHASPLKQGRVWSALSSNRKREDGEDQKKIQINITQNCLITWVWETLHILFLSWFLQCILIYQRFYI
jgi:hypothetical protein